MNSLHLLRTAGLVSALAAAFSAQAVSLHLYSEGSVAFTGVYPPIYNETVFAQSGGFGPLSYFDTILGPYDPSVGYPTVQRYTGAVGDLAITILTGVYDSSLDLTTGTWSVDTSNCTGLWSDAVGSGTYSLDIGDTLGSAHISETFRTLDGTVDFAPPGSGRAPVPEPASMATLGLGALACVRRRRHGRALR